MSRRGRRPWPLGLLVSVILVSGAARSSPVGAPGQGRPEPPPAADLQAAAGRLLDLLAAGKFEEATKGFDAAMKEGLPTAKLGQTWALLNQQAGPFQKKIG